MTEENKEHEKTWQVSWLVVGLKNIILILVVLIVSIKVTPWAMCGLFFLSGISTSPSITIKEGDIEIIISGSILTFENDSSKVRALERMFNGDPIIISKIKEQLSKRS